MNQAGGIAAGPALAPGSRRRRPDYRRAGVVILMLVPGLTLLAFLLIWPLGIMLQLSFKERLARSAAYTLSKYKDIFLDSYVLETALRTFVMAGIVTVLCAVLAFPVAWFLARGESRYKHLVFLAVIFPLLVSIVVRTMGWTILLGSEGVINSILLGLGIVKEPLRLMLGFWTVVVGLVHVLLPFMVLSIASVLGKIDRALGEAAYTLGANPAQTFVRVTLPLAIQGIAAGSIIVFCLSIGAYVTPAWLGRGSVTVLATMITDQMTVMVDWPAGSALSMILIAVTVALLSGYALSIRGLARR